MLPGDVLKYEFTRTTIKFHGFLKNKKTETNSQVVVLWVDFKNTKKNPIKTNKQKQVTANCLAVTERRSTVEVGVAQPGANKTNVDTVQYRSYPKSTFLTAKTEKEKH